MRPMERCPVPRVVAAFLSAVTVSFLVAGTAIVVRAAPPAIDRATNLIDDAGFDDQHRETEPMRV